MYTLTATRTPAATPRVAVTPTRAAAGGGSCPSGCWLERDSSGNYYCYCGDTGAWASTRALHGAGTSPYRILGLAFVIGAAVWFLRSRR